MLKGIGCLILLVVAQSAYGQSNALLDPNGVPPAPANEQNALGAVQPPGSASLLESARQPIPGSDRDAHGCIASAGYAWCQREAACVRPWELATARGFKNTEPAFHAFCRQDTPK